MWPNSNKQFWIGAAVLGLTVGGYLAGIAIDRWTNLDPQSLLLYLTAVGALAAAAAAYHQVSISQRALAEAAEASRAATRAAAAAENGNEMSRAALLPSLTVVSYRFRPAGVFALIRNGGGGAGRGILIEVALDHGITRPYPPFDSFGTRGETAISALGPGEELERLVLNAANVAGGYQRYGVGGGVALYYRFRYFDIFGSRHEDEMDVMEMGWVNANQPGTPLNPQ